MPGTLPERLDAFLQAACAWPDGAVREIATSLREPAYAFDAESVEIAVAEALIAGVYAIDLTLMSAADDPPDTARMVTEAKGLMDDLRALGYRQADGPMQKRRPPRED